MHAHTHAPHMHRSRLQAAPSTKVPHGCYGMVLPTCRVVPQLVQELVHLKGGGQRLDEAGGLDGACRGEGRGAGTKGAGGWLLRGHPRVAENNCQAGRQAASRRGCPPLGLRLCTLGPALAQPPCCAPVLPLLCPCCLLTVGDAQQALALHEDVVPQPALKVGLRTGGRAGGVHSRQAGRQNGLKRTTGSGARLGKKRPSAAQPAQLPWQALKPRPSRSLAHCTLLPRPPPPALACILGCSTKSRCGRVAVRRGVSVVAIDTRNMKNGAVDEVARHLQWAAACCCTTCPCRSSSRGTHQIEVGARPAVQQLLCVVEEVERKVKDAACAHKRKCEDSEQGACCQGHQAVGSRPAGGVLEHAR